MATVETAYTMADYVALLKRRRRIVLTVLPASILISTFFAFWLPAEYEATATILIQTSSVPEAMVATTVASGSNQQISMVKRNAMSKDNVRALVAKVDPYPDQPDLSVEEKVSRVISSTSVEKVDPISFKRDIRGDAFTIQYRNPDRRVAKEVMKEIVLLFLEFNRDTRTRAADETYQFLLQRSRQIEGQIREADQKISDFKRRYGDALPEDRVRNEVALERAQSTLDQLDAQIRDAEQRESDLSIQLGQLSPTLVGAAGDRRNELVTAKAELAAAEQRYTPDHPDVKRLRRAVAELAVRGAAADGAGAVPDNPEYLRVSSALAAARRDAIALKETAARTRGQMHAAASHLAMTPGVERDYVELQRAQAMARDQFADIQDKLHTAEVARTFETELQGERYTLIRAAAVPSSPVSPNRLGLILVGIVLGGALMVGLAALAETSDPTVRSYHDLRQVCDVPLLGAVPVLLNPDDARRRKLLVGAYAAAFGIATLIVGVTVVRADAGASHSSEVRTLKSTGEQAVP